MTFLEIRNEVEARADDTSLSDSQLNTWINLAYRDVLARWDGQWPFLLAVDTQNTVANQAAYNLPSDFSKAYDLTVATAAGASTTDNYAFVPFEDRNVDYSALFYTINYNDSQFILSPAPTEAGRQITLTYFSDPLDLSADSDEPVIPNRFHEVLIYTVLSRYYQRWREPGMTAHMQELAEQIIDSMKSYYQREQSAQRPVALRSSHAVEQQQKSLLFT